MQFDPTITLGALINALVILVGFVVAFTRLGGRLDLMSQRLQAMEDTLDRARDNDKRITITEERVTNHGRSIAVIQQDIYSLRRGEGWVQSRMSVDGEYERKDK